jgi:S1-C subfamily serine protease
MRHDVPRILLVKSIRSQYRPRRAYDNQRSRDNSNGSADSDAKRGGRNLGIGPRILFVMILSLCLPAMSVSGQSPEITSAENLQDRISRTIAKVEPAVVFVATFQSTPGQAFRKDEDPFDALMENRGLMATTSGCGVVIGMEETQQSRAWLVLTGIEAIRAAAVSEEAENVVVAIHTNAGVTHRAMVLAADPMIGLAVLRVPADLPVPPIVWNPKLAALDVPQKGWLTLLIDSPSPMRKNSGSVDLGLISNIIRLPVDPPRPTQSPPVPHPYLPGKYLAIGANGIPAHGGVPVLSLDGNLLGLIDALAASSREAPGKALAIPCTGRYARLIAALQDGLEVEYGWLGVSARSADALPKEARPGVEVTQVWRGGPADRAGIQTGDILLNVGEVSVEDELDLNREIALFEPGAVVDISRSSPIPSP